MFFLIMNFISTNPDFGPQIFGAIVDVFIIGMLIYLILGKDTTDEKVL